MNSFYTLSNILRGKWLIEPGFAESQGAVVANILNRYTEFQRQEPDPMMAFVVGVSGESISTARYSYSQGWEKAEKGSIAVVKIKGTLFKDDQYCGPDGMETIGSMLKQADAHPKIAGIVISIDSPGGTVDGTEALANIVKNLKKPNITHVDGMMCSAAAWIGTSANEVMASTDTDDVGSIGVLSSFADVQPYWESLGIKFHTIPSSTSPEKVKMWMDVREGKYDQYIKEVLDPIDEKFMKAIRENRPAVQDKHLTGKVFFARDVMGIFVDSIGTLEDAIIKVHQEATRRSSDGNSSTAHAQHQNDTQINFAMKYPKLVSALSLDNETFVTEADGGRTFTQEELQAVETALGTDNSPELQGAVTTLESHLQTANDTITAHEATIAGRDQRIAELEAENASLRGQAAVPPAAARTDTDPVVKDNSPKPVSESYENPMDALGEVSKEYLNREL